MKQAQLGASMIEMMIVVTIIGLLTTLAIPVYTDYGIRAQISEGLQLAGSAKAAVTEYYNQSNEFPTDNAAAGLDEPDSIVGKHVSSVSVNGAVVSIQYGNDAHALITGQTITMTAIDNGGSVSWVCAPTGIIQQNQLPPICR